MKTTRKCVKCGSTGIIVVPGQAGAFGVGNNIPMGKTIFSSVKVSRYLCDSCGYSEEWVDDASDLQRLREKYKN
jgi:predicted nucleic-acid-binding Zn-ribbon protein